MTEATQVVCTPRLVLDGLQHFAQEKMCGRCLPCPLGVGQARAILVRLTEGRAHAEDLTRLARIAAQLRVTARCRRGKEAAELLLQALQNPEELQEHLHGRCVRAACPPLRKFRVLPERCTMCGRCQEVCPRGAILGDPYVAYLGDNRPYLIKEKKCNGCGVCADVCPAGAIVST